MKDNLVVEKRQRIQGVMLGLVVALIWGGYLAVSRHAIVDGFNEYELAFLRYASCSVVILPLWLFRCHQYFNRPQEQTLVILLGRSLVLAALAGPLFVIVGAGGYHYAPLAHGAVIQLGSVTLGSAILAAWCLNQRLGRSQFFGLLVLLAGLLSIAGPAILEGGSNAWKGDLLFVFAGCLWSVFSTLLQRWKMTPITAVMAVSFLSTLSYGSWFLTVYGTSWLKHSWDALFEVVAVQGVASGILAVYAYARCVQLLGSANAALFAALAPACAMLLGVPLTGEWPTLGQWSGLIVVSMGLLIALRKNSK